MFRPLLRGKHTLEKGEIATENCNGPVSAKCNGILVYDTAIILVSKDTSEDLNSQEFFSACGKVYFILSLTSVWQMMSNLGMVQQHINMSDMIF